MYKLLPILLILLIACNLPEAKSTHDQKPKVKYVLEDGTPCKEEHDEIVCENGVKCMKTNNDLYCW